MFNDFVINPALAGRSSFYEVRTNIRYQWVGITGAPRTFLASVNVPYKPQHIGTGGYIFYDQAGPLLRTGINAAYSYHVEAGKFLKISMGLFGGILQYRIDRDKVNLADEEELYLFDGGITATVPDASFGTWAYNERFFAGFSIKHLFHNKVKQNIFNTESRNYGYLINHLFIIAGYKYLLREDMELEPSLMFKILRPVSPQVEAGLRYIYRRELWLGVVYRTSDALSVLTGYIFQERFWFGYSYDLTISGLKHYSDGTHELMLGYLFNEQKPVSVDKQKTFY